jgi:hypothetical protein
MDVQIMFQSVSSPSPVWCLYTKKTRIEEIEGRNVIIFEIYYDVKLTPLNRPVLDMQNALQAVNGQAHFNVPIHYQLPPYIMLSHEMLHMLLRLDYILAGLSLPIQEKVADIKNGNLKLFNEFLDITYSQLSPLVQMKSFFELWGAGETQREELIVILGGIYTMETKTFILGETQFLREHYGNNNIITWTHLFFEVIADAQGEITHRKFLNNAFQLKHIQARLEAFPFLIR